MSLDVEPAADERRLKEQNPVPIILPLKARSIIHMKHWTRQFTVFMAALALMIIGLGAVQGQTPGATGSAAAPRVISATPAQREVVKPDTAIQLVFDQPMDRASVGSAFTIDPKVDGKLDWRDDSTLT